MLMMRKIQDFGKGKACVQEKLKQNEEHLTLKREVIVICCLQYKPLGNVFSMHLDLLKQSLKTCAFHILVLENLVLLKLTSYRKSVACLHRNHIVSSWVSSPPGKI